jgi:SSS family solute:Na+ symporter
VWCDLFQFVIKFGGIGLILYMCVTAVPENLFGIVTYAFEHHRGFEYFDDPRFFQISPYIRLNFWLLIFCSITTPLFECSADQLGIQKLLSTSSYQQAKKTLFTHVFISMPFVALFFFLGLAMFVYYEHNPASGVTGDTALFRFVASRMPSPIPGLVISSLIAAALSTIAAGINSLTTVVTTDFYKRIFRPDSNDAQQVRFSRLFTVVNGIGIILVSLFISAANDRIGQTVIELSGLWLAMFMPVIAPIFLLGVTTKKLSGNNIITLACISWAATACMITWFLLTKHTERPVSFMWLPIPSYIIMIVGGYLWALCAKPLDPKKIENLTLWTLKKEMTQHADPVGTR